MAKDNGAKVEASEPLHDAVAIGLRMRLPEDVLKKYAVGKWVAARLGPEHIDDDGTRWVTMSMPIDNVREARSDTICAIAVIRAGDGYSVARLEMPLAVADRYLVESSDPEGRGFAVDQAQRRIAESAERA
jgi:hypothetical protein